MIKLTLIRLFLTVSAVTFLAFTGLAENKKERKVTLPNGKVLINPFVISNTPSSLEVGHNNGIAKVMLKDCPPKIQKKYGYSPEKAAAYIKEQDKKRKELQKKEQEEARQKKIQDEKFRRYRRDASIENLEIDIKKIENRIDFLNKEIPRLQSSNNTLLDKTTTMATTSVSNNNNRQNGYSWYGGYYYSNSSNSAGKRAERTKEKQIDKLDDEYAMNKHRLRTYQKELERKQTELLQLKQRLNRAKSQKKNEAPLPKK